MNTSCKVNQLAIKERCFPIEKPTKFMLAHLDKDSAKRKDAAQENGNNWTHVPWLFGNLARNLVGSSWIIRRLKSNCIPSEQRERTK